MKAWPGVVVADSLDELEQPDQQRMGADAPLSARPQIGSSQTEPGEPQGSSGEQFPGQEVDPAQVMNTQQTVAEGFDTPLPDEAAARFSPEDEAHIVDLLKNRKDDEAIRFAASKGFELPTIDQVIAHRNKTNQLADNFEYLKPVPLDDDGAAGAIARGIADTPTAGFADELHGLAQGVEKAITGDQSEQGFWHDVHVADDVYSGRVDRDEVEHPLARIGGQLIGGLAIPLSYEGVGLRAGTLAMREAGAAGSSAREALVIGRRAAARAVTKAMARDGVIIGGAHGVGTGEGVGGRVAEGLAEAGLGAAGGAAIGKAGEAVAPRLVAKAAATRAAPLTEEQEIIRAADRQGIDNILPADVGGPMTRRATSMVSQTFVGGAPIKNAARDMTEQAKAARDRIAATIGQALEPEAAGQTAITGAQKYVTESGREARRFYAPAERASEGLKVAVPKALTVLGENISALQETPGSAPGLSVLQGIHDSLLDGKASVAGIRRMRTVLRDQFMKDGLTGSDLERRVNMVIDAAAEDVRDGLSAAGKPDAAANFAAGDAAWKTRARTIETTIRPLIGTPDKPKSGEQVIRTLTADLQGNNARAVKFLRALPDEEQRNVRASIIGALGKAKVGQQGSEGTEFSLNTFLTNWNQVGETAKAAYFGPEARAALNDLAKIAEGSREAQGYANMSNTGGVLLNALTVMSGFGGLKTAGINIGTQYGLGRLLASPRFARWLARAPKTSLSVPSYVERLGRIAKAEPAIAGDILSLQQRLTEAIRQQPMRAAADDKTDTEQSP